MIERARDLVCSNAKFTVGNHIINHAKYIVNYINHTYLLSFRLGNTKSNFFVYQEILIKIERGFELDLVCPKMHNVSEITSMHSMSNLRFAEHMGG